MPQPEPDSLERLTSSELIGVVRELIGEVRRLQTENEKLNGALAKLKVEHQAVKDEVARLKGLPPRPPHKPSGMDKGTSVEGPAAGGEKGGRSPRRRGSHLDKLEIDETVVVEAAAPAGSRHKGYHDIVVQDLNLRPKVTRCRRERRETPEGKTIVAELDAGTIGGYGPNLHRLVLARLNTRPFWLATVGSMSSERSVRSRARVRSSSALAIRLKPTTSAARMAASLRSMNEPLRPFTNT